MKRYNNERTVQFQGKKGQLIALDLLDFPTVEDFSITPVLGQIRGWDNPQPHLVGAHFHSQQKGYLGGCSWWESIFYLNQIVPIVTAEDVPKGSLESPHSDFQVTWQIVIFEHEKQVYLLQADDDQTDIFPTWFRVSSQNYVSAWLNALRSIRIKQNELRF